jgi:hypothetical protein
VTFSLKWPTLDVIKRAREKTIINFFNSRGGPAGVNTEQRLKAIKGAVALTVDDSVILPYKMLDTSL